MSALPQSEEAVLRRLIRVYLLPFSIFFTLLIGFMEGSL